MVFCQATSEVMYYAGRILHRFEVASGQMMNREKSLVVFSWNTPWEARQVLADIIGVRVKEKHGKHLSLPATIGRSMREVFQHLKDRVWAKL
ncbi:UNVERIFIED_CONTAM: hypothetical protein Slati_1412400 [Sesamum latifolium]|uniref:Uncharacterized protein n=1 Tax=Sesamum latifolium TaxID=2727402 RepID=A0AAW2X8S0_9LAMI